MIVTIVSNKFRSSLHATLFLFFCLNLYCLEFQCCNCWLLFVDEKVREGIGRLSTLILGANTLIQGALPEILRQTPQSFHDTLNQTLHTHASYLFDRISKIRGLTPIRPHGAMYMMVILLSSRSTLSFTL